MVNFMFGNLRKMRAKCVLALLLSMSLYSCSLGYKGSKNPTLVGYESPEVREQRKQDRLRRDYGATLESLVSLLAQEASDVVSPKSGREHTGYAYIYEKLEEGDGWVSCRAVLNWEARDLARGVPYGRCTVEGTVYYLPNRNGQRMVEFQVSKWNDQVANICSEKKLQKLTNGLVRVLK